ncbi:MAG: hypothetical protein DRZ80_01710 [Thermoprotei archaeon]|nr:MAG: hypothetical protein DRZ80_01710 [Thermoprotei archaeon]
MEVLKRIIRIFILGETRIEKALSMALGILLIMLAITGSYWLITREYNKYTIALTNVIVLFAGTLMLRVKIINVKKEAERLAQENYEKMKISLEDAIRYFESRAELSVFKDWLTLIVGMFLISTLIILVFPV